MKRVFRMAIILIPVTLVLAGIGLWRHHYLKIMNAEPVKVYNTLGQSNKPPTNTKTSKVTPISKVTSVKDEDKTDATTQRTDNRIAPGKINNIGNSSAGTIFGDIAEEDLTPEVVAALEEYEEIPIALLGLNNELEPLLEAIPLDMDALRLVNEKKRNLKQRRKDILDNLAMYSDEAFNELQATIAREKAAKTIVGELDEPASTNESAADRAAEKENAAKIKRMEEELDELYKSIPTMSREELEQASEKLKELKEELSNSKN